MITKNIKRLFIFERQLRFLIVCKDLRSVYNTGENRETERKWGCPRGVMVKALDSKIVVSEFVFQSHYYIHFLANTLGKGMKLLILPAMG